MVVTRFSNSTWQIGRTFDRVRPFTAIIATTIISYNHNLGVNQDFPVGHSTWSTVAVNPDQFPHFMLSIKVKLKTLFKLLKKFSEVMNGV